jgi:hypothetical protein
VQVPTLPVAVLNASTAPSAARRLADQLIRVGVRIGTVGNLVEARPPGLWVLYAPGARDQAVRLAHVLSGRTPTIEPIDPAAQAASGHASLAVVIG